MRRSIALALMFALAGSASAEPAPPPATRAMMRKIARGTIHAADLVDPATGFVFIVYTTGEAEPPVRKSARRLCGAAAKRELAAQRSFLKSAIDADEAFSCRNKPGPPSCTAGIVGEFGVLAEYVFRPTDSGTLVLDALILTNSAYKPDDEASVIGELRARHASGTCPR